MITELNDNSPFPFGMHQGKKMKDVPASYLHWVWTKGKHTQKSTLAVKDYVKRNLSALKKEHPDGIWNI